MPEHTIILMNEYEKKLSQYRAEETQKERLKRWKNVFWSSLSFLPNLLKTGRRNSKLEKVSQHPNLPTILESSSSDSDEWETDTASVPEPFEHDDSEKYEVAQTTWHKILLHFVVWSGFFAYAVHVEFGTVYLLLSAFYFMWINTRTGPKRPNEISAYSVFNRNCERIQGTLDAETLEKEMKYGLII